jgi:DNA-binding transcriptional LysR family regulator
MTISFNRLDLNLLRVFDAVMEERSVLRASERVFLSQSAVSHSLARLRGVLNDELFIPSPTGMQPTSRALTMAPLIREAWKSLQAAIELPEFEPRSSTRRFTIAVSDFITTVMAPRLLELLRQDAPLVDFVIRADTRMDLATQIDLGRIDAAIGTFAGVPQRFRSSLLFEYDDVLITGSSQNLGELSIGKLSSLSIVVVSPEGAADGFVSERGLTRRSEMYDRIVFERACSSSKCVPRIAASLPDFLALPELLCNSCLAAIVPRPLAKWFARGHPISAYELPYTTTHLEVRSLWHERHESDTSQDWLRGILRSATEHLRDNSAKANPTLSTLPASRRADLYSFSSMSSPSG